MLNPYIMHDVELELNDGNDARCDVEYELEEESIVVGRILYTGTQSQITEDQFNDDRYLANLIYNYIEYLSDPE